MFWASASFKDASFHYCREIRGLIQILHRIFKRLLSFSLQESMFCLKVRTSCDTFLCRTLSNSRRRQWQPLEGSLFYFLLLCSFSSPRFFCSVLLSFYQIFICSLLQLYLYSKGGAVAISLGTFLFPFTSFN